jgi:prepilin-type N-terminal cleavage/methylation domain-containing protein
MRPLQKAAGFTLIELLVVIAIIGLLSAVVLAALTTARNNARDQSVKSNLDTIVSQASEDYFYNNSSYGIQTWVANASSYTPQGGLGGESPLFTDETVGNALNAIAQIYGSVSYASNESSWIIVSKMSSNYWCEDSAGHKMATSLVPSVVYNYGGSPGSFYSCIYVGV